VTPYDFLLETYETERIKTLSVWSQFGDDDLGFRPAPLARTPHEQMVHQCVSEHLWMTGMLGIEIDLQPLPAPETRLAFIRHYATASEKRVGLLRDKTAAWFEETTAFFNVQRTKAWVMTRRLTHSAHHRAQLTVYLRLLGKPLYSTYGPTADTGGLFQNRAPIIYRYASVEELVAAEERGGDFPPLPGPGEKSPTERG